MSDFEPKVVAFLCNWCSYGAADAAGASRKTHPANVRIVRVLCSGRIDPQFVVKAFAEGADGVMLLGCHPGDCNYRQGNVQARKRYFLLRRMLAQFGIAEERIVLDWVSAGESDKFVQLTSTMVDSVKSLGPLREISQ